MQALRSIILICLACVLSGTLCSQAIHVVNTTSDNDDGVCDATHCSLREALRESNDNTGPDSIAFNIPGVGNQVILVNSPLPAIRDSFLTIDGTTQPFNFPMNGRIVIDGSALSNAADHGLVVYARQTHIYGLVVRNFPGDGIQIFGGFLDDPHISDITIGAPDRGNVISGNDSYGIEGPVDKRVTIQNNYIGTDLAFTPGLGNAWDGIFLQVLTGEDLLIGGSFIADESNFLCSNGYSGLRIRIEDAAMISPSARITANRIGTEITTLDDLGNLGGTFGGGMAGGGIVVLGEGALRIGGSADSVNVIAYNPEGIFLDGVSRKTLYQNQFLCNADAGIALANAANDAIEPPNSICVGANVIQGQSMPNARIDAYLHDESGCTGVPCQGRVYLGTTQANASGTWMMNTAVAMGSPVTAVATNAMGSTSEFSRCSALLDAMAANTGPYCQGDSIFLLTEFIGTPINPTFMWSGPAGYFSAEQNPVDATLPGIYTLIVTDGGCTPDTSTTEVIVNPFTFAELTDVCLGDTFLINGTVYDINNTLGSEILEGANQFGCDSLININLQFNISLEGRIAAPRYACIGDTVTYTIEVDLGPAGPYEVIYTDGINAPDTLQNIFDGHEITQVVTENLFLELLELNASFTVCDAIIGTSDTVFVSDLQLSPTVSDYGGTNVSCGGGSDGFIALNVTGSVGDVTFDWSNPGLTDSVETDLRAGVYSVTVTDAAGCSAVFDTVLTEPDGLEPIINVSRPTCFGATDGSIEISDVGGVEGTLLFSTDSMTFNPVSGFPIVLDMLPAGQQFLYFTDDSDCVLATEVFVPAGDFPFVDAGPKISIFNGDSVSLGFNTDFVDPNINWSPASVVSCQDCPNPVAFPTQTQFITVTLTNAQGCFATDSVLVEVFSPKRVYIPNVFSPNGDQINDYFYVQGNEFAVAIESIIVLERGGVVVYSGQDLPLNMETAGWDGSFKGQEVNPGVYAYLIKVRFSDNKIIPYSGTVTLVR